MNKLFVNMMIILLLTTGFSLIHEDKSSVEAKEGPTRGFEDWTMDMNIADASAASFLGENESDHSGRSVSNAGDVNGDGYDDILIGAQQNDQGGIDAGKTYLILGKPAGGMTNTTLANADASFIGEFEGDSSGSSVSGAGDVNGDGYDDILIGARSNNEGGDSAGQTYLILGKESGWSKDNSLSTADASFIGESESDFSGGSVSGAGDVNGDGYDDILIGARGDDEAGDRAGKTYLIMGKASGWTMNTTLANADAFYTGEDALDSSGGSVSGAGDVNGDGYDDIVIGAYRDEDGGTSAGQTYLILGKGSGWSKINSLSNADASFIGEDANDHSGDSVAGAGDVNGDGFNDILIGAYGDDDGGSSAGQTYLILGKASGWTMDINLSTADASFIGEFEGDSSGSSVSGAGDVNNDGYDDILIDAHVNDEGDHNAGQTYLIFGKGSGWALDKTLSTVDASFIGEYADDWSGSSVSGAGDFNGDGNDDIIIGAGWNDGGYPGAGQTYLITGYINTEPKEVYSVDLYSDPGFNVPISVADIGDFIYVELIGLDGNETHQDAAKINVTFRPGSVNLKIVNCIETGDNTGIYRGTFIIPPGTIYLDTLNFSSRKDPTKFGTLFIDKPFRPTSVETLKVCYEPACTMEIDKAEINETIYIEVTGQDSNPIMRNFAFVNITSDVTTPLPIITLLQETEMDSGIYRGEFTIPDTMVELEDLDVYAVKNPTLTSSVTLGKMLVIGPIEPVRDAYEDELFSVQYSNLGLADTSIWAFSSDCDWLSFDAETLILSGEPDNSDIGLIKIELNLSDPYDRFVVQKFQLTVNNLEPILIGDNVLTATQDELYSMDYDSTDDGLGNTTYHIWTTASWLTMDKSTGELSGTPTNDDVGRVLVGVSVHDGNGGVDNTQFNLTVIDVNDQCLIDTENIITVYQDEPYRRTYTAIDLDPVDSFTWTLVTDAEWLSMDQDIGVLEGAPTNNDVGIYIVNITLMDSGGLTDSTEFRLEVLNVNDRPEWIEVPEDSEITHGEFYYFETNATDIDPGTTLSYSISTNPDSEMSIDIDTGIIEWHSTIHIFEGLSKTMEVTIGVFDGGLYNNYSFNIEVLPSRTPSVTLLSPSDGDKISSTMGVLTWEGSDPEGDELIYSLYLSKEEPLVSTLQETAMIKTDFNSTSFTPGILEVGETYYWTVIPNDGCSDGRCSNDVFSFEVNAPPKISSIDAQKATSGSGFSFYVVVTDDDDTSKTFSLDEAPEGMTIDDLGKIEWTPKDNQVGEHIVIVNVSDGVDYELVSFKLTVAEGEEESSSLLPIILIIAVILIAAVVIFFIMKKKKEEESETGEEEEHELTKEETYEAMYGEPAPKEEEGMTTEDLKGYIHEQIEELEEGKEE